VPPLAPDDGLPGGLPVSHFISNDSGSNPTGAVLSLTIGDTWTEGYRSAYVTTELWSGYAQVWVQPLYLPVTSWNDNGTPNVAVDAAGAQHPIFSVGPGSTFYSPYWQTVFFDLPAGASAADFTSARQVIDSGALLHPAGSALMPLAPAAPIGQPVDAGPIAPFRTVSMIPTGTGWLDGQPINFFNFGGSTFQWNSDRVVGELPLFTFLARDTNGGLRTLDVLPTVGGVGPLFSGIDLAPPMPSQQPLHYGALWRAYTVTIPATAGVFAPPQLPDIAETLHLKDGIDAPPVSAEIAGAQLVSVQQWAGRVAMNPSCFDTLDHLDPTNGPGGCVWLDSQKAIEEEIDPAWIRATDILLTCPFVSYQDTAVPW
jgi:hypothetical protein